MPAWTDAANREEPSDATTEPPAAFAAGQAIHPAGPRSRQRCGATSSGRPTRPYAAARSSSTEDPGQAAGIAQRLSDTVSRTIVTAAVTGTGSRCSAGMGNAAQVRRLRPASTRPAADPARPDALLRHAPSAPRGSGRNLTALRYLPHCRPGLPLPRVRETFRTFERGTRLAGVHPASRPARRVSGHAGRIFGNNVRAELSFS